MFQYAAAHACVMRSGSELRLDLSTFGNRKYINPEGFLLEKLFGVSTPPATILNKMSVLGVFFPLLRVKNRVRLERLSDSYLVESRLFEKDPRLDELDSRNAYLNGWWQTASYFKEIESEILKLFTFREDSLSAGYVELVESISGQNSVAIHVRRGDYVSNEAYREIYGVCSNEYYEAAIRKIQERQVNTKFFVVTDDPAWVARQSLFADMQIVSAGSGEGSWNDMYFMSRCRHNIIANSTFSWWAAWLNSNSEKIVVCPQNWFANGTKTPDLYPLEWIQV